MDLMYMYFSCALFKGGRMHSGVLCLKDGTHSGRPKTSMTETNVESVNAVVEVDGFHWKTGISEGSVHAILKDHVGIKMCTVGAPFAHWG